jgi:hypothetical protein
MVRKQYRFWTTNEELQAFIESNPNINEFLKDLVIKLKNGVLVIPESNEDLKKQKLQVDIRFKEIMIKIKEQELLYNQTFDKSPSYSAKRAMKIGVENQIPETPSCFDEKNNRIMCPECGSCFVFGSDKNDIAVSKENFIDHYIQKHGMKFPDQIKKELQSF